MEKRYIGIDLHRNRFTCCIRLENGRTYLREWDLKDLVRFVKELRAGDEVAVEITGNTRLFHERGGAARKASGGSGHQSVSGHQSIGEENRSERRAAAVVVSIEGSAARGAHEG